MDCYILICSSGIFGSYSWVNPAKYEAAWKLVTKWLRNSPIGNSLLVSLHYPLHFFMFHLLFPQFLWAFPMFPLVFLLVPYFKSCCGKFPSNHIAPPNNLFIQNPCFSFFSKAESHSTGFSISSSIIAQSLMFSYFCGEHKWFIAVKLSTLNYNSTKTS